MRQHHLHHPRYRCNGLVSLYMRRYVHIRRQVVVEWAGPTLIRQKRLSTNGMTTAFDPTAGKLVVEGLWNAKPFKWQTC